MTDLHISIFNLLYYSITCTRVENAKTESWEGKLANLICNAKYVGNLLDVVEGGLVEEPVVLGLLLRRDVRSVNVRRRLRNRLLLRRRIVVHLGDKLRRNIVLLNITQPFSLHLAPSFLWESRAQTEPYPPCPAWIGPPASAHLARRTDPSPPWPSYRTCKGTSCSPGDSCPVVKRFETLHYRFLLIGFS